MSNTRTAEAEVGPYESQVEYLQGLRRVMAARRAINELLFDEADPDCGARARPEPPDDPDDARLTELARELTAAREQHQQRTVLARQAGIVLPLDEFCVRHELDCDDRRLIEAVLVEMMDVTREQGTVSFGSVARYLGDWQAEATQAFLGRALPESSLVKKGLLGVARLKPSASAWLVSVTKNAFGELFERAEPPVLATEPERAAADDVRAFLAGRGVALEPDAMEEVELLWAETRHGGRVLSDWGFGANDAAVSIIALFHGPSGTGKTLTARTLADALGRDLHAVCYADLMSMYIGETEKNICRMFAAARKQNAVLLIDEADAMLGRRGEISRAVDRHLNMEVNTMLMEIERHSGLVILTTNNASLLDPALERRIRHRVLFAAPGAATRARIWRARIPAQAPLADDVDLFALGSEFELTGGQIANAALVAAMRAASRVDGALITGDDLRAAARRELSGHQAEAKKRVGF